MCNRRLLVAVMAIEQLNSKHGIKITRGLKHLILLLISINNSVNNLHPCFIYFLKIYKSELYTLVTASASIALCTGNKHCFSVMKAVSKEKTSNIVVNLFFKA